MRLGLGPTVRHLLVSLVLACPGSRPLPGPVPGAPPPLPHPPSPPSHTSRHGPNAGGEVQGVDPMGELPEDAETGRHGLVPPSRMVPAAWVQGGGMLPVRSQEYVSQRVPKVPFGTRRTKVWTGANVTPGSVQFLSSQSPDSGSVSKLWFPSLLHSQHPQAHPHPPTHIPTDTDRHTR